MTERRRDETVKMAAAMVSLLLIGASARHLMPASAGRSRLSGSAPSTGPGVPAQDGSAAHSREVVVTLTKESLDARGISVAMVPARTAPPGVQLAGTVEPERSQPVLLVPKQAVQDVGDRHVVYLSSSIDRGRFVEREVRLGRVVGDDIEVLSGLMAGDSVVSTGSAVVRGEAERKDDPGSRGARIP